MEITNKQAKLLAEILCIQTTDAHKMDNMDYRYQEGIPLDEWKFAINIELEHGYKDEYTNVTNDNLLKTARIALAHIREFPNYYKALRNMEATLAAEKKAKKYENAKIVVKNNCKTSSRLTQDLKYLRTRKTSVVIPYMPQRIWLLGGRSKKVRFTTQVQSVIFDKNRWTKSKAEKWLTKHKFKHTKVDATKNTLRFRQVPPKGFKTYRTITFSDKHGIKAVLGMKLKKND